MSSDSVSQSCTDRRYLQAALRLARKHEGLTGTNPSVACLIVADLPGGRAVVGSAVTAPGGRPHAEPPALAEAGSLAKGATAYVTLEPCAHHGKTPPCAQTLIDAGIKRVVTAITDPDNRVNGQGHRMLLDAGVEVVTLDGGEEARRVLQGYLKSRTASRPFVTLKMAMTREGLIGCSNNGNLRISGSVAKGITHLVRARHDAILVGKKTAMIDDPGLTCRLPGLEDRSPLRVVMDANAELSPDYHVVSSARYTPTLVVAPADSPATWRKMLTDHGVKLMSCECINGRIALPEFLDDLAANGIQSLMVEGGATIAKSFIEDGLVDEIILHIGGNPELPKDMSKAVYAPICPENLPDGFEICQSSVFGADTSLRLRKSECSPA